MRRKLKGFGSFLIILFLLPYVITVFFNGTAIQTLGKGSSEVIEVQSVDEEGNTRTLQVPWEQYFIGVLAKEMPETYEEEALKAQAVLIRTNLYKTLDQEDGNILGSSYLSDKELEKKWQAGQFDEYYKKLKNAIESTANQVIFYNDTYALVPFHKSSNGQTRSGTEALGTEDYPYLVVRECSADKEAQDEIHVETIDYSQIQKQCQSFLVAVEKEKADKKLTFSDFEIISYDSAGYISQLRIGETTCTGEQFRDALNLASSTFSLQDYNGKLRITTTGNGHGLGMSQWTANDLAKAGKSYEEILQYFFEGTVLQDGGEIYTKLD